MQQASPTGTIELLVKVEFGRALTSELTQWAVSALEDGFDSPSLRVLAGFPSREPSAEPLMFLQRTLSELGYPIPVRDLLLRQYGANIAQLILDGSVSTREGVRQMHESVVSPLNHAPDVMGWCYLSSDFIIDEVSQQYRELSDSEYDEAVRKEAIRLISLFGPKNDEPNESSGRNK